jgi:hypothetical protein
MRAHLFTTYYRTSEQAREEENLRCLVKNIENPLIETIHLVLQGEDLPPIPPTDKIRFVPHGKRPTFRELFTMANALEDGVIRMVSNSDIYFNETLKDVPAALKKWDILAMTRWDVTSDDRLEFFHNFKSQDCWIYNKPLDTDGLGNYFIGQYGCDNRLLHELYQKGLKVGNPSFTIVTEHLHRSNLRTYLKDPNYVSVPLPYGYVLPDYLDSTSACYRNFHYVNLRYQFYKSVWNDNLASYEPDRAERFMAFFRMKFFAWLSNRLRS